MNAELSSYRSAVSASQRSLLVIPTASRLVIRLATLFRPDVGTPLGVLVNSAGSGRAFGILLGVFVALVGVLVWWREHRLDARVNVNRQHSRHSTLMLATLGVVIAAASGLFGIGGPMLTVPVLVACGVPVLSSLAAAQAQSVVIAGVGTLGYSLKAPSPGPWHC